jgi:hypothetical protein
MSLTTRVRISLALLLILGGIVFFTGTGWGLPSRANDRFLFGNADRSWSAQRIVAAGGAWESDTHRAADADTNPLATQGQPLWLNQTEKDQAEIIRRYRLFSSQPDEMVTFMALAGMRGDHFDPRLYQYGGLWIYPVGGLLKIASMVGLVTVKPDMNYYLDHPEEFGRFYRVARIYSGLWGLVGVWAVFALVRRFSQRLIVAIAAAVCFILLPIVINGTHEAKPHLAGAVLTILSALAACRYVETGTRKWALITGAVCGLAVGMVLSAAVAFVVIPLMMLLRPSPWRVRVTWGLAAIAVGMLVYAVTNPYVPINLLRDPGVVRANLGALGKAKAIVGASNDIGAVANARLLVVEGASVVGGVLGVTGVLLLIVNRAWWTRHPRERVTLILLGTPALLILAQFVYLAGGKTGEFGRFAVLPDIVLMLIGVVMVASIRWGRAWPEAMMACLVLLVGFQGLSYWAGFLEDARGGSRVIVAERLAELYAKGARTLGVRAEPAPYCLPPVDITGWKIVLLPAEGGVPDGTDAPDVIIRPVDAIGRGGLVAGMVYRQIDYKGNWPWLKTRISWADKPFELLIKRSRLGPGQ